ncbi:endonuclease III [Lysobacter enzymogenes]|uniref:Endonuclease III n=2 Tax=Lysobacter TaxID=68 RepID=A0A0S2DJS2_LYSEN|nr:endonuclease III [Lysobacter enzymogenes]
MPKTAPASRPATSARSASSAANKPAAKRTSAAGSAKKNPASKSAGKTVASKAATKKPAAKKIAPTRAAAKKTAAKPSPKPVRPSARVDATVRERPGAQMKPAQIEEMFARLQALNPHPTTELEYTTPFELLVAVALSAQATDVGVNKATRKLFPVANTPRALVDLGVDGLKPYIATIGLFNTKAQNVIALSQQLLDRHGGEVPRERAALEALPGVGRKTANVVLNTAFGEPTIAVDTHIFRVSNRTGLAPGKDVLAVEHKLVKVVPDRYLQDAHHWLILHGRYVCKARKPDCPHCAIRDLCRFPDQTPGDPEPVAV